MKLSATATPTRASTSTLRSRSSWSRSAICRAIEIQCPGDVGAAVVLRPIEDMLCHGLAVGLAAGDDVGWQSGGDGGLELLLELGHGALAGRPGMREQVLGREGHHRLDDDAVVVSLAGLAR